ncbi:hypothetical protein DFJ74DRAFT_725144 [Hyaloraphidium curvatum]|nr:hypothetical protein DFJ74DRAFT_725144 [Hyaloraphidium curvatum]
MAPTEPELRELALRVVAAFNHFVPTRSIEAYEGLIGPDYAAVLEEPAAEVGEWLPPAPHRVHFKGKCTADFGTGTLAFYARTTLFVTDDLKVVRLVNEHTGDPAEDAAFQGLLEARITADPKDPEEKAKGRALMEAFCAHRTLEGAGKELFADDCEFVGFTGYYKGKAATVVALKRTDDLAVSHEFRILEFHELWVPHTVRALVSGKWDMVPEYQGMRGTEGPSMFELTYDPATGKIRRMVIVLVGDVTIEWGKAVCAMIKSMVAQAA